MGWFKRNPRLMCKLCHIYSRFGMKPSPYGGYVCADDRACDQRQLGRGGLFFHDAPAPTVSRDPFPPRDGT